MSRVNPQRKVPVMAMPNAHPNEGEPRRPRPRAEMPTGKRKHAIHAGLGRKTLRLMLRNPLDSVAVLAVVIMAGSIINNALFAQNASHPAPMFSNTTAAHNPAPVSQPKDPIAATLAGTTPTDNSPSHIDLVKNIQEQLASRGLYSGTVDGVFGPRTSAAISAYESAAGMRITGAASPEVLQSLTGKRTQTTPSGKHSSSKVIAVQHVLAEQGFGPLKVDGVFADTTREAIKRFETSRNLPATGELTPAFLKELSAVSGVALDG